MPKLAVDWDGTLVDGDWPGRNGAFKKGAVEALQFLLDDGWDVIVHTCRIAPILRDGRRRPDTAVEREISTIRKRLDDVGLEKVSVHTEPWKPAADVYLDDRAIRFTEWPAFMITLLDLGYLNSIGG